MSLRTKDEVNAIVTLCELFGYGRVMQVASAEWQKKDPRGALIAVCCAAERQTYQAAPEMLAALKGVVSAWDSALTSPNFTQPPYEVAVRAALAKAEGPLIDHTRIEMPHAGHFVAANHCRFRRNTFVNGFIVSTVGELFLSELRMLTLGLGLSDFYETMVFRATPSRSMCCPWEMATHTEIERAHYPTAEAAQSGHEVMVEKYAAGGAQ